MAKVKIFNITSFLAILAILFAAYVGIAEWRNQVIRSDLNAVTENSLRTASVAQKTADDQSAYVSSALQQNREMLASLRELRVEVSDWITNEKRQRAIQRQQPQVSQRQTAVLPQCWTEVIKTQQFGSAQVVKRDLQRRPCK